MAQILIYLQFMRLFIILLVCLGAGSLKGQTWNEGITVLGSDTIHCPDIQNGDTVEAVFYIANYGIEKFKILQVHPSCQCTAPQYANDTFEPGRKDSVILFFHSKKTEELEFEKYAIVLTPLGERTFYIKGKMYFPANTGEARHSKMIRLTNSK